jgi:assimilatory nitrate reductase catalytic subunit
LFQAIEAGKVKAVWIMGTNPAVSLPDTDQVRRALGKCELVVVSDCVRHTDTADLAHIRLPALTWGERDGTVTNSERCISRQHPFLTVLGEARQDWEIVADVARAMGFADHFRYQTAHEIFREHTALSAFENDGGRCFNLGAWRDISAQEYADLQPTQWPVLEPGRGTERLFTDGKFFTASGKAQFIAVTPRLPQVVRTPDYPFVMNTGRVRDHWHTLTRTGISPRLSAHVAEPTVEIHPCDVRDQCLQDGGLARIHNTLGEILVRVKTSRDQQRGSLFVPMHWSGQFSSAAGVGRLIPAVVDPISGQPESKHATVAIAPYQVQWHGFLILRRKINPATDYWTAIKTEHAWHYELAGSETADNWAAFARELLCQHDCDVNWTEYLDTARQTYRAARFIGKQLESCLFISTSSTLLPTREWLISLFAQETLQPTDRIGLLAGKPAVVGEDKGRTVCACFKVGEKTIRKAIAEQGLKTVEDIGRCLNAGTNCGSCVPELKSLLA